MEIRKRRSLEELKQNFLLKHRGEAVTVVEQPSITLMNAALQVTSEKMKAIGERLYGDDWTSSERFTQVEGVVQEMWPHVAANSTDSQRLFITTSQDFYQAVLEKQRELETSR